MDGVGGGQEAYAAAVDGQKQERQWTVISHQCSKSRHIQAKVLWGQRRGCQVSLPWALSVPAVRMSASREPSLVIRHLVWRLLHLSAGQVVRVRRYSGNEFTEDNPKGEDVSLEVGDGPCPGAELSWQLSCVGWVTVRDMGEGGGPEHLVGLLLDRALFKVSGRLGALTFSSYSSPRNTSGAIQYGEPTTANGSFLAPSLQEQGSQNLLFRHLPQEKRMGVSPLPTHRKCHWGFTHV